jgi:hypothetical protein
MKSTSAHPIANASRLHPSGTMREKPYTAISTPKNWVISVVQNRIPAGKGRDQKWCSCTCQVNRQVPCYGKLTEDYGDCAYDAGDDQNFAHLPACSLLQRFSIVVCNHHYGQIVEQGKDDDHYSRQWIEIEDNNGKCEKYEYTNSLCDSICCEVVHTLKYFMTFLDRIDYKKIAVDWQSVVNILTIITYVLEDIL